MDHPSETTTDEQSDKLAAYIARYIKRGITIDKIRKVLEHNDWDERTFNQAVSDARELLAREARREDEAERAKHAKRQKRPDRKDRRHSHASGHDEEEVRESSAGAASFSQDEAILLHEPPKTDKADKPRRTATASRHASETEEDLETSDNLLALDADIEVPLNGRAPASERHQAAITQADSPADNPSDIPSHAAPHSQVRIGRFGNLSMPAGLNGSRPPLPPLDSLNSPAYPQAPWQGTAPGTYPYAYPYPPNNWQNPPAPAGFYGYPYADPRQAAWPPNPSQTLQPPTGSYPYPGSPYGYPSPQIYGANPSPAWNTPQAPYNPYQMVVGTGFDTPEPVAETAAPHRASGANSTPPYGRQANSPYALKQALLDSYRSVANNAVNFILSVFLSYVAAGVMAYLALMLVSKLFTLKSNIVLATVKHVLQAAFGSMAVYAVLYIMAGTVVVSLMSLALADGGQKRQRPINALILRAIAMSGRVSGSLLLTACLVFLPAALIVIIPTVTLVGTHALAQLFHMSPYLHIAALLWIIMSSMRYALIPYVALFGRDRLGNMPRKSHDLLKGSGQWIVAQMTAGMAAVAIIVSVATGHGWLRAVSADNLVSLGVLAGLFLIYNAVLVMLYRSQKPTRGRL